MDGIIAESSEQRKELWVLRDGLNEAQKPEGGSIKHDVSIPISNVSKFITQATEAVKNMFQIVNQLLLGILVTEIFILI